MLVWAFTNPKTMVRTGNTWVCQNHNISERSNYILLTLIQHGLQHWDICILPIKKGAFINQQMEERPGSKHCTWMIIPAVLISISNRTIRRTFMQACGIAHVGHGNLKKVERRVAFIKVMMAEKHGKWYPDRALVF